MEIIGELIGYVIVDVIGSAIGGLLRYLSRRSATARVIVDRRVSCGLRATSGRVYNIGTDWSTGKASLRAGRMTFDPKTGSVERRRILVIEVDRSEARIAQDLPLRNGIVWQLVTPQGRLEWAVDSRLVDAAAAALKVPITK